MAKATIVAREVRDDAILYVRLSHRGLARFVTLRIPVKLKEWDPKRQRLRKSANTSAALNARLAEIQSEAEASIRECFAEGSVVTADKIADRFRQKMRGTERSLDFLAYADDIVDQYRERGKIGTYKAFKTAVGKLRRFLGKRRALPFDELTPAVIRRFETFMVSIGNKPNTVHKSLSSIRTILYQAIRDGHLAQEKNPFFQVTLRRQNAKKERLTFEQIQSIESAEFEGLTARIRDYWMFAFYTGGMRFSDVATLKHEHIRDGRIGYRMRKTSQDTSIVLLPQALEILERFERRPKEPWVFPILDGQRTKSATEMHNAISRKNALVNKYLKKVAAGAGVDVSLSFHMARHSLADYLRSIGWTIYDISKALNHASVGITEAYLAGFDSDDLDEKMRDAF